MTHELKIQPKYFNAVLMGTKTFEIRKNDRGYKVGDMLILKEWIPDIQIHTGKELARKVTYITDYQQKPGYVVMSIG
ncbi:RNA-binding protein [Levilactobacillus brevis]|uniref:ASCH/PUA domain-containing protein n=1 Tax=Levilactobacillus brevis TaxID=1580 RepID=UPI000A111AF5|nr:ASCH/PUA domain-containing protein [Levilactobacillus brevis]ORJ53953.1 RNA-binding protein [Levilactobacillus brevis]